MVPFAQGRPPVVVVVGCREPPFFRTVGAGLDSPGQRTNCINEISVYEKTVCRQDRLVTLFQEASHGRQTVEEIVRNHPFVE